MKKLLLAILGTLLLLLGLWCTIRRRPGALPAVEDTQSAFRVESAERGSRIRYDDPQTPLRSLRWLAPLRNGYLVAQVVTQTDRQRIVLFKDGTLQAIYLIPKPDGVREGFFRLAELRDACVEGDVAVLLYASSSDEPRLVVALDLGTKDLRWIHRALGEHLALGDGVVYLFGPQGPPVRLPLALVSGEHTSPAGLRSAARTIPLPMEIQGIADLEPTGAWTFLLVHQGGLSAYRGTKGWLHRPTPEGRPAWFQGFQPTLGRDGRNYWWQPFPGPILQVLADGTPKTAWPNLPTAAPFARDADLLHFLGVDGNGQLWFDLAVPSPSPAPTPSASTEVPPEPGVVPEIQDWSAYVNQGLGRLYRWDPRKQELQRFSWSTLTMPPGFPRPMDGLALAPEAGLLRLANGSSAWLLPLSALPLEAPSPTGRQPK